MPYKNEAVRREYHRQYMREYQEEGRKKPKLFMTCEEGRHSKCIHIIKLAGNIAFRCSCNCHPKAVERED